jgi:ABC-type branched-subunit amino acid transport system ATPase component
VNAVQGLSAVLVEENAQKILGVTDLTLIIERGHMSDSASLQNSRTLPETYVGVPDVKRQGARPNATHVV